MARLNGFYQTTAWTRCRNAYFDSVGGLCERCKAKGIINAGRVVHHKTFLTEKNVNDPAIAFGFDNLILLCQACHEEVHRGVKRYVFNADGSISPTVRTDDNAEPTPR